MARDAGTLLDNLTPREREVLEHLRRGLTNGEIAQRLGVSDSAISNHVSEILSKLGVGNRYEAAAWPERPPWWVGAVAPLAFVSRKAFGLAPAGARWAAAAVSLGVLAAGVAGAVVLVLALRDDGGASVVTDGTIEVPQSAVERLTNFAFTSDLSVQAADGDLALQFDGAFAAADRVQGTLTLEGGGSYAELWESALQRPLETEVVVIGEEAWYRDADGVWQPGIESGDSLDPLVDFASYATPFFYLEALRFDTLPLPVAGAAQEINGVRALPVRLDKQGVIDVLAQGNEIKLYPGTEDEHNSIFPGISENAQQVLPASFSVEVWFEERLLYPVRIVFDYDITEADFSTLSFGFDPPLSLRLQMDITNPALNAEIFPPIAVPTEAPSPTTAPGELTDGQRAQIAEIVSVDPRVAEIAGGRSYSTSLPFFVWGTADLETLGGAVHVTFDEPFAYEGEWPTVIFDETRDPPFREVPVRYRADQIVQLQVLVYLPEERVVEIEPVDAIILPPERTVPVEPPPPVD